MSETNKLRKRVSNGDDVKSYILNIIYTVLTENFV